MQQPLDSFGYFNERAKGHHPGYPSVDDVTAAVAGNKLLSGRKRNVSMFGRMSITSSTRRFTDR